MRLGIATIVVATFLATGLVGHDPWKPDEGYTFGLVVDMLEHGNWLIPHLAGEPFLEKPPLYFWTAASFARAFGAFLPPHDGARLASLFYMAIGFFALAATARRLFGVGAGGRAALLAAGTLGLLLHAHEMITDTALFAGMAVAMAGLAMALERPGRGGALLGTGSGIAFMAKGLLGPGVVALAVLMLLAGRRYRVRVFARALALSVAFAMPWLVAWPLALYLGDPSAFETWFWTNNLGRFLGYAHLGATTEPGFYTTTLPWFTFPAGWLAAWTAWRAWRGDAGELRAPMAAPAALALAMLAVLGLSATSRALYALPLVAPLAVLGSASVPRLPRDVGMAATCAATVLALALVMLAWILYGADVLGLQLARPASFVRWFAGDYRLRARPIAITAALLVTAAWFALWLRRGTPWLTLWTAAIAAPWAVWMTLMLPWIDHAKSFREPFEEVAPLLRAAPCIQSHGLGEPQRAMLHYMAGVDTQRLETGPSDCPYVLVQSDARGHLPSLSASWTLRWQGQRPGERNERFQLWERRDAGIRVRTAARSTRTGDRDRPQLERSRLPSR